VCNSIVKHYNVGVMANSVEIPNVVKAAPVESEPSVVERVESKRWAPAVGWTTVGFAAIQSMCTLMQGLGAGRLVINFLSLAAAASVFHTVRFIHQDSLRRPMIIVAVVGAVLNLIVVAQVRRLRNRPAARWRLDMARLPKLIRQENWQIRLSVLALVLVAVEETIHIVVHHRW
jgi:hypothetical protein